MAELITSNIDELGDFWLKQVYPFVRPIVKADQKGRVSPLASGVLVSNLEKKYLLTAYHVTKDACTLNEGGMLMLDTFAPEQIEITGVNNYVNDPPDLSLTELAPTSARCLQLPRHLAFDIKEGELCLILGFPARSKSWEIDHTRRSLKPAPFSFLGTVMKSSAGRFGVRYSPENTYRNGQKLQRRGKLNGISGGGAFVLRKDEPRLAGIIIEYHANHRQIICTDSGVVWSLASQVGSGTE